MSAGPPIVTRIYEDALLTIFDGEQTAQDVDRYLARLTEVHARDRDYVGISLMLRYAAPRDQMQRIGAFIAEHKDDVARLCRGTAIITPHLGFRFLLSSLFMIQRMPNPYTVAGNADDAFAWVRAEGHGAMLSAELERDVREELRQRGHA